LSSQSKESSSELQEAQLLERLPSVKTSTVKWLSTETSKFRYSVSTVSIKVRITLILDIDKKTVDVANYDFDHPSAIDFDLAY